MARLFSVFSFFLFLAPFFCEPVLSFDQKRTIKNLDLQSIHPYLTDFISSVRKDETRDFLLGDQQSKEAVKNRQAFIKKIENLESLLKNKEDNQQKLSLINSEMEEIFKKMHQDYIHSHAKIQRASMNENDKKRFIFNLGEDYMRNYAASKFLMIQVKAVMLNAGEMAKLQKEIQDLKKQNSTLALLAGSCSKGNEMATKEAPSAGRGAHPNQRRLAPLPLESYQGRKKIELTEKKREVEKIGGLNGQKGALGQTGKPPRAETAVEIRKAAGSMVH